MGRFLTSLGRAIKAARSGPDSRRYVLVGKPIVCPHCGHDHFIRGRALLNSAGMTFFNLDWAEKTATTLACSDCGRITWFLEEPEELR